MSRLSFLPPFWVPPPAHLTYLRSSPSPAKFRLPLPFPPLPFRSPPSPTTEPKCAKSKNWNEKNFVFPVNGWYVIASSPVDLSLVSYSRSIRDMYREIDSRIYHSIWTCTIIFCSIRLRTHTRFSDNGRTFFLLLRLSFRFIIFPIENNMCTTRKL